jgi:hypothetical protein
MSAPSKPKPVKPHQEKITQEVEYLKVLVGRPPISFYEPFGRIAGSAGGGLFLSQLVYWSPKGSSTDGWIYKPQRQWTEETCLKRGEQESARRTLMELGILEEEKRGIPCQLFFRVNFIKLREAILNLCEDSAADPENNLPQTKQGWLDALLELVEAGIWDYETHTQKITNLRGFKIKVVSRLKKAIEENAKPDLPDIEALELHREFKKRVKQKLEAEQAAAEARKKEAERPKQDKESGSAKLAAMKKNIKSIFDC